MSRYDASEEGIVAEVNNMLNGYSMAAGVVSFSVGRSSEVNSTGWPRAALMSANNFRVCSWKSGSTRGVSL